MPALRNPSVMQHSFGQVPRAEIPRSTFNRSHGYKTTFDAGWLIPVYVDEALPGDTHSVRMTGFARLATPIHPIMDNMMMDSHFFSIPLRLVWDNFQKFNGEQKNPGDSTDFLVPQSISPGGGYALHSLQDYLGIPIGIAGIEHSALFTRAYNLVYNEWFRDQNLQNSVTVDTGDGPDNVANYVLLRRGKRHDYFTSCLPWPQKGTAVSIFGSASAPVITMAADQVTGVNANNYRMRQTSDGAYPTPANMIGVNTNGAVMTTTTAATVSTGLYPANLAANLAAATAATINTLREAFQIQKLLERDARGGTRYTEIIRSHFGVVSPDQRLQRPEFLGGGSSPVIVTPIAQTSATSAQPTPQGNLGAMGTAVLNGHGFTASFTEHCIIIGLVSVRADLTYSQGLHRMFSRRTRYDFYWPALAHLGEQAVLRKEIWCNGVDNDDNTVFGYQERHAEYRYKPSQLTGLMRVDAAGTLASWHLSQDFAAAPTLNSSFIVEDPPVDRVIAVPAEPHFIFDSYFQVRSARPMPVYGVPGFIDRF